MDDRGAERGAPRWSPRDDEAMLWDIAWQRKGLIIGGAIVAAVVTFASLMQVSPVYRAKTLVMLDSNAPVVVDVPSMIRQRPTNAALSESAVIVMKSNDVLRAVVEELSLDERAEYNPALRRPSVKARLRNAVYGLFGSGNDADDAGTSDALAALQTRDRLAGTVSGLRSQVKTQILGESYVIEIAAKSSNPRLAAAISDTIAEEYLAKQLRSRELAGGQATDILEIRVAELRTDVAIAELKLAEFRNGVMDSGVGMSDEFAPRLTDVNQRIAQLSGELADVEQRKQEIAGLRSTSNYLALTEEMRNPVVTDLYADLASQEKQITDLRERYGDHSIVDAATQRRDVIMAQLDEQVDRALAALSVRADVISDQQSDLKELQQVTRRELANLRQNELTFEELEREAVAARDVYNRFLLRLKEVKERNLFQAPEAVIVSYAEVPANPISPEKMKTSMVGGVGGGLAVLAFLGLSLSKRGRVASINDVVRLTDVSTILQLPRIVGARSAAAVLRKSQASASSGLKRSADWLRLRLIANEAAGVDVILVTSLREGEGKSAVSLLLADSYAKVGYDTVVLQADGAPASDGHQDFAVETVTGDVFDALRSRKARGGVQTPSQSRLSQADVIIVDGPPLANSSDEIDVGLIADKVVLVCAWNTIPEWELKHGVDLLQSEGITVSAIAINKVPQGVMDANTAPFRAVKSPLSLPPPQAT